MKHSLAWIEISKPNFEHNIKGFKELIGSKKRLCVAVKANAYGHGLAQSAKIMASAGVDVFGVNALFEAMDLKEAGIKKPIYIMGYVALEELETVVKNGFEMVVYSMETLKELAKICKKLKKSVKTHLKFETGTSRQGIFEHQVEDFLNFYKKNSLVQLYGVATHFANIEDTSDFTYAYKQIENFEKMLVTVRKCGFEPARIHCANTAATMLMDKKHFNMVRVGIGAYGLWPSEEVEEHMREVKPSFKLKPVLSFKTKIAQIKELAKGTYIGYGCTYVTNKKSKIAVLPVGYYDGYDRRLSNCGRVLINGKFAPVRGRIFMNMMVVDVTEIPNVKVENEVTIIGFDGKNQVSADELAKRVGTINYEITTRLNERIERKVKLL